MQVTLARRLSLLAPVLALALAGLWWWRTDSAVPPAVIQRAEPSVALKAALPPASVQGHQAGLTQAGPPTPALAPSSAALPNTAASAQASYREARRALHERDLYRSYVRLYDARVPGSTLAARLLKVECRVAWMSAKLALPSDATAAPGVLDPVIGEDAALRSLRLAAQQEVQTRCKPLMDDASRSNAPENDPHAPHLSEQARSLRPMERYELAVRSGDALYVLGMLNDPRGPEPFFEGQPLGGARRDVFNRALDLARLRYGWDPQASSPSLGSLTLCAERGRCGSDPEQLLGAGPPSFSDPAVQDMARRLQAALARGDVDAFLKGNVTVRKP